MAESARVSVASAIESIVAALKPVPSEMIRLGDLVGRVAAEDVPAPFPLPPWTNASMDGYAVHSADIVGASASHPKTLRIVAESRAGDDVAISPVAGEALRIFTGAAVPPGIDTVIRQEDCEVNGTQLRVLADRDARANIRQIGSDIVTGDIALRTGVRIGAAQVAILSALGISSIRVFGRPRVGVLVTGDELAHPDDHAAIRSQKRLADANGPMLAALINAAGGEAVVLGIAGDDPDSIRAAISGAPPIDLLLTAGGVSVGAYDHLPTVMLGLGAQLEFRRVRIRPGGPTMFGRLPNGLPWLGLPGNPVSAFVTFTLFGQAAVRALAGNRRAIEPAVAVTSATAIARDATLELYVRVTLNPMTHGALPVASPTGPQGSGMLTSIVGADALLRVPAGQGQIEPGDVLEAWLLK